MTYSAGSTILASDYNTFATNTNAFWATGSGSLGWGQTTLSSVSTSGVVTATNWASLVNNLATASNQTGITITTRTAPVTGNTISILTNLAADITNITNAADDAVAIGAQQANWSGTTSKTTATGSAGATWTITFTHTVTFADAASARYFFNAGGIVKVKYGKSSTGTDIDADWNTFAGQCGVINITGRVNSANQTIAGVNYSGTTRIGGTGGTQTTLATTTGWYSLTPGAAATTLFQLNNATSPYTGEYIATTAAVNAGSTTLTLVTTWFQPAVTGLGTTCNISGGTATASPSTTITGTAPTTLVTYVPPSTSYLTTASWGTPTIAASVT
jgi:hypothetical protein